jgi:crotonobetainyl-CoA:carnitine CoA-transferase CaiB-like acyl-CoA transferase
VTSTELPLAGTTVVEAGLLVQGPQASAALQLLGADVVKVELPNIGDTARWLPIAPGDFRSAYFIACNRGKRSVTVDLRTPSGRAVFLRLLETADVLITNFKPGTMEAWDLGYDVVAAVNPRLVYATGSAFGARGPDAEREGADLSAQAAGGLIHGIGVDGGPPSPIPTTICDHIASQNLVSGVLAALLARERTGRGQRVEVSLLGSQLWAQAAEYTYTLLTGLEAGRANNGHPLIPGIYGTFPTADGWVALVGLVGPARQAFFEAIGRADLLTDERFASPLLPADARDELFALIGEATAARPTAEWCETFTALGIRHAPVRGRVDVVADPQVWANDYLVHDADGTPMVGAPITLGDGALRHTSAVPALGEHTDAVLADLGYTAEDIARLRTEGAV